MSPRLAFPEGFLWSVGTASYQVEGAADADGKGPSIWDTFSHRAGTVLHGDNGDIACDQYRRIETDVELMVELGIPAYRFSISWPRVQPDGRGPVNAAGLDHYRRLVELLRRRGIEALVTLYHWDLPQALQDGGGWADRDTAFRFAEYAGIVGSALGGEVTLWTTVNEPWVSAFAGYATGRLAPGIRDLGAAVKASHHLLLGHGLAARALAEAAGPSLRVGISLNLAPVSPVTSGAGDVAAARRFDGHLNRWFLDPVLRGSYPEELLAEYLPFVGGDFLREGDLETIRADIDFLGVNFYERRRVAATTAGAQAGAGTGQEGGPSYERWLGVTDARRGDVPRTSKGWTIEPDGLTELLLRLREDYGDVPLYVTENGAAFPDYVDPEGNVKDPERVEFLAGHFAAAHAAISQGVDVRGYSVWSLLDNFEWADGYSQRFGVVFVDYRTQERIPKTSAYWLRDVIAANALETVPTVADAARAVRG